MSLTSECHLNQYMFNNNNNNNNNRTHPQILHSLPSLFCINDDAYFSMFTQEAELSVINRVTV